jgi:hypothetical protein
MGTPGATDIIGRMPRHSPDEQRHHRRLLPGRIPGPPAEDGSKAWVIPDSLYVVKKCL